MRVNMDSQTREYILARGGHVTIIAPRPAAG